MLDSDLTAVLRRRVMAFAIDAGLVGLITALVARSQFEKFPLDPDAWTTAQFDRLVELNESFHRMQELGDNQYVIDGPGLLLTAAIGSVLATIIFVLLPASTGWSPGKKMFGLRVTGDDGSSPRLGQLVVRTFALLVDLLPYVIPGLLGAVIARAGSHRQRLGDRFANTLVVDARKHGSDQPATEPSSHSDETTDTVDAAPPVKPSAPAKPTEPDSPVPETGVPETAVTETAVEPRVPASLAPPGSLAPPEALKPPTNRKKIDVAEFLDPEPAAPTTADLVEAAAAHHDVAADEPLLLSEPLPGKFSADSGLGSRLGSNKADAAAAVPPPALAGPAKKANVPEPVIDFEVDPEQAADSTELPPPPAHREPDWDPPRAEPAPVWRPNEREEPAPTEPVTEPATEPTAEPAAISRDEPAAISRDEPAAISRDEPADGPTDPVWSDDWQAWLYWDSKRRRWLRHDLDTGGWVPIS